MKRRLPLVINVFEFIVYLTFSQVDSFRLVRWKLLYLIIMIVVCMDCVLARREYLVFLQCKYIGI
jgi:hypothetical protein